MEPSQQHPGPGFGVGLGASGPALTSPFASQEAGGGGVGGCSCFLLRPKALAEFLCNVDTEGA